VPEMKKRRNKGLLNPFAKSLSDRLFSQKVVKSKKLYNRLKERSITLKAAANKED